MSAQAEFIDSMISQPNAPSFSAVTRISGVVVSVDSGGTLTVTIGEPSSGTPVPGVKYSASYSPLAGDTVMMDVVDGDVCVVFKVATATGEGGPTTGDYKASSRATIPGWLICAGGSFATATYAALFALYGYTFGGGGANFNVPDARDRTLVGAGTSFALHAMGGEVTHVLTAAELPAHDHSTSAGGVLQGGGTGSGGAGTTYRLAGLTSVGGGGAHNNMPPYLAVNLFVKT